MFDHALVGMGSGHKQQSIQLHQVEAVEDAALNLLNVVRCTSRTLTPEQQAELIARHEPSGPSCGHASTSSTS